MGCGPTVDEEGRWLFRLVEESLRQPGVVVIELREDPPRPIQCTALVGWITTGKFRRRLAARLQLPASPERRRAIAHDIAAIWVDHGLVVDTFERGEGPSGRNFFVKAESEDGASLWLHGPVHGGRIGYLSAQTACRESTD